MEKERYLYVSGSNNLVTTEKMSIDDLESKGITPNGMQCFRILPDSVEKVNYFKDITDTFTKLGFVVTSSEIAKAGTMSPRDLLYGVRLKNGKRVSATDNKADHIRCSNCQKPAYKKQKVWEKDSVPLYHCEACGKVFKEI